MVEPKKDITGQAGDGKKQVAYDLTGSCGVGYTAKEEPFLFDKEDYDKIKDYSWYYNSSGYLQARVEYGNGKSKILRLHQAVMGKAPKGYEIDHIRHPVGAHAHKFDNRKKNLRFVTRAENMYNAGLRTNNSSGHTGVSWDKGCRKWRVAVSKGGKRISKRFPADQFDAACTYQEALSRELFGEYAYIAGNPGQDAPRECGCKTGGRMRYGHRGLHRSMARYLRNLLYAAGRHGDRRHP